MGYDWYAMIHLMMDEEGNPMVWEGSHLVPYQPLHFLVPSEHREFLKMRGPHLRIYTDSLEDEHPTWEVDPYYIVDVFPSWTTVMKTIDVELYDWTEEKHNALRAALEWMHEKMIYRIVWSR